MVPNTSTTYLFDTNLLVDYWRGNNLPAKRWMDKAIDGDIGAGISIVTDMELWVGVKDKRSERDHKILLARFRRFQFNLTIARRAGELKRWAKENHHSEAGFPDLVIAATAEYYRTNIVTRNIKHFGGLPLRGISVLSVDEEIPA